MFMYMLVLVPYRTSTTVPLGTEAHNASVRLAIWM